MKGRSQLPGIVQKYLEGKLKVDEFITGTFKLEDINKAFDAMHDHEKITYVNAPPSQSCLTN